VPTSYSGSTTRPAAPDAETGDSSLSQPSGEEEGRVGDQAEANCLGGATTIMIRRLSTRITQQELMRTINHAGFWQRYDFFYLPMKSRGSRGFAFVNFDTADTAQDFFKAFNGHKLETQGSELPLEVVAADVQGFEENARHYSRFRGSRRLGFSQPFFFRAMPPGSVKLPVMYQDVTGLKPQVKIREETRESRRPYSSTCGQCRTTLAPEHRFCMYCGLPVGL